MRRLLLSLVLAGSAACSMLPSQQTPPATVVVTVTVVMTPEQGGTIEAPPPTSEQTPEQLAPTPAPRPTHDFNATPRPTHLAATPRPTRVVEAPTPRPTRTPKVKPTRTPKVAPTEELVNPLDTPAPTEVAIATPLPPITPDSNVRGGAPLDLTLPKPTKDLALTRLRIEPGDEGLTFTFEFSADVPKHRVFRMQNPNRIMVDLEATELPGGSLGPKAGPSPVTDLKGNELGGASGNPVARLTFTLDADGALPGKPAEETDGHVLKVTFKQKKTPP